MHRSVLVAVVAVVLTAAVVGATISLPVSAVEPADGIRSSIDSADDDGIEPDRREGATPQFRVSPSVQDVDEFDSVTYDIVVYENGSATWTFRYERTLNRSNGEVSEFETFAEEFEEEETDIYDTFTTMSQALMETGAEATDREMEATDYNRSADIEYRPGAMGVVEMSFTWHGFAAVDEDAGTVTVGDVFEGGLYLGNSQTLVITAGDDLVFETVRPDAEYTGTSLETSDAVSWQGEREFLDGQPRVVFLTSEAAESGDDGGDGQAGDDSESAGETPPWAMLAAIGFVLVGVLGGFAWYRFGGVDADEADLPDDRGSAESPAGSTAAESEQEFISDEELMTDEDRVVSLISQNGGRMKQVNIVEETGWSKSKVSMLLSDMEEDGTISKLRVGRENIISLEGFEPEATKSPFEK